MKAMEAMRKRFRGAMVGAAIGDALGADYEFMSSQAIELAVELYIANMRDGGAL